MGRVRDISLDREGILTAAFGLLDKAGLNGITMRALAERLSVKAPALYWHVKDKSELISLMAESLYLDARLRVGAAYSAADWLVGLGMSMRDTLSRHRDAARLLTFAAPSTKSDASLARQIGEPLLSFGFGLEESLEAQAAVISLTVGWTLYRDNSEMGAYLSGMFDLDESYRRGLYFLAEGFSKRVSSV